MESLTLCPGAALRRRRPLVTTEACVGVLCGAREIRGLEKFEAWTWRWDARSWLAMLFQTKRQTGSKTMSIWKMAIACSVTAVVIGGQIGQASAAPMPTNIATMKAAA